MSKFTDSLEKAGLKDNLLNPEKMTDEELTSLRFTYLSEEDERKIIDEIDKRSSKS